MTAGGVVTTRVTSSPGFPSFRKTRTWSSPCCAARGEGAVTPAATTSPAIAAQRGRRRTAGTLAAAPGRSVRRPCGADERAPKVQHVTTRPDRGELAWDNQRVVDGVLGVLRQPGSPEVSSHWLVLLAVGLPLIVVAATLSW